MRRQQRGNQRKTFPLSIPVHDDCQAGGPGIVDPMKELVQLRVEVDGVHAGQISENKQADRSPLEMWCYQDSNRGHMDFQSIALPTEL